MTRAQLESALVLNAGKDNGILSKSGLATTTAGTNADLNWPIYLGLQRLGFDAADPSNVQDSDLSLVPARRVRALIASCDLEVWIMVQGVWAAKEDQFMATGDARYYSQVAKAIQRMIELKQKAVASLVSGMAMVSGGFRAGRPVDTGSPPDALCVPWQNFEV